MTGDASRRAAHSARLYDLLLVNDFTGLAALFEAFFASIPHQWYTNNDIAGYEGFYASVFYSYFAGLGLDVAGGGQQQPRRLDMAVRFNGQVYLFEFKVVELAPEGAAMAQLKAKGYADKYRDRGEPIHLIAVEFSKEARNLAAFDVEQGLIGIDAARTRRSTTLCRRTGKACSGTNSWRRTTPSSGASFRISTSRRPSPAHPALTARGGVRPTAPWRAPPPGCSRGRSSPRDTRTRRAARRDSSWESTRSTASCTRWDRSR